MSQVDLTRPKESKAYLLSTNSLKDTGASFSFPSHPKQSTTPEKERKKYNELHSTGRVKDLIKQKKISLEKLFTKFDYTHHDEVSPYKKKL
jgi:hypothetical protein